MVSASLADNPGVSLRVGIDLVSVASVRDALDAHSRRYLERIYTDREIAESMQRKSVDPRRLAARFAVKEAVIKVLRPDPDQEVPWRSIAVHRQASGAPIVELDGAVARLAAREGVSNISTSLTHEGDYAGAVVIAEIASAA